MGPQGLRRELLSLKHSHGRESYKCQGTGGALCPTLAQTLRTPTGQCPSGTLLWHRRNRAPREWGFICNGVGTHMREGGWHHRQSSALAKVKLTGPLALGAHAVPWDLLPSPSTTGSIMALLTPVPRGGQDRQPCTRQACCPHCTLMAGGGSGLTCPLAGDDGHRPQKNCTDPGGSKPVLQPQCVPREGTTGGVKA